MKAIGKIIGIVSLTLISFSGNAQEVKKQKNTEPVRKTIVQPANDTKPKANHPKVVKRQAIKKAPVKKVPENTIKAKE